MGRGRAFWPVLTLVLLGHGAVLTLLTATPPPLDLGLAAPPLRVFQVRAVVPAARPEPEPPPAAVAPAPAPAPEPLPAPAPAPVPAPQPQPEPPTEVAAVPAPPEPPYLPRSQLTAAPMLLTQVDVPFPDGIKGIVALKVRATLFIDEQGGVRRVRVDTPDVHPAFEQAILAAFSQARFKPGEIQQAAVRSQLRVEVEFSAASPRPR